MPQDDGERDEAAMAAALWRSLVGLLVIGIFAGFIVWWFTRTPPSKQAGNIPRPPRQPESPAVPPPVIPFRNITDWAGIRFHHVNGARGEKLLPETMGGGVAFFDADADGDQDLFLVNSMNWPGVSSGIGEAGATSELYLNDGTGRFANATKGSGLDGPFYGMGVAVGDYDNDGRDDLFVTAVGGARLFHNEGNARFREVTQSAGVGGDPADWSTAAAWFDFDNDGDLDLFVGHYVRWSPELDREVNNTLVGIGRAYGQPREFPGTAPRLYRNDRSGKFTDVTLRSGLVMRNPATGLPIAKTLSVVPIDLNRDGWMDLVVANDTVRNFAFTNRMNGTFEEVGREMGIAFDAYGQPRGAMGIDAARFREDDDSLGIAIGNFANEMNALYVSQSYQLIFADEAIPSGLGPASRLLLKFGLFFFDYDLDGRLDILTANGHLDENIGKVQKDVQYRQPAQLFWNAGGSRTFVPAGAAESGADLFEPAVGRGSAFADIDGDGDLDVIMTQIGGPVRLFRNERPPGGKWLRFRLVGTSSNRNAIGAWIEVRSGGRSLARQVMPTRSYLSQSELPVTIGLGQGMAGVDRITVAWPGGQIQSVDIPAELNRVVVVRQNDVEAGGKK